MESLILKSFCDVFEAIKRDCGGLVFREFLSGHDQSYVLEHDEVAQLAFELVALSKPKDQDGSTLETLVDTIIFEYDKSLGHFVVFEGGEYFGIDFTIDQMMKLSQEIAELAQKARQEEGAE